ncbi:MAG TPA: gamma-glutamyl-phosphate reductase, partial [Opitutae bacterium]|nr:gamma-glutamyl-phosphate reductase [Opitutae bacterium]
RARTASLALNGSTEEEKNQTLKAIAQNLESNRKTLLEENQKDLDVAG